MELLVPNSTINAVNRPKRRRRRHGGQRNTSTAAQRAAIKKLSAIQRQLRLQRAEEKRQELLRQLGSSDVPCVKIPIVQRHVSSKVLSAYHRLLCVSQKSGSLYTLQGYQSSGVETTGTPRNCIRDYSLPINLRHLSAAQLWGRGICNDTFDSSGRRR
uniref:Chorismate synthase n=1 Tax=Lygus hesperus TaxID=30085 RepID=A0A0A9XIC6_LYGHE